MRGAMGLVLVAFLLLRAVTADATTVCVSTTEGPFGLRAALDQWEASTDSSFTIELVQGTYAFPYFEEWFQGYTGNNNGSAPLQFLGGFNPGCNGRVLVASNTVLDGSGYSGSFFYLKGAGSVLVEGITFRSFGAGLGFESTSSDSADSLVVRYVIGSDLLGDASYQQPGYDGVTVVGQSAVRVESSLFDNVHGGDGNAALAVFCNFPNTNAVITNVTAAGNAARGLYMGCPDYGDGHGIVAAYNLILWNNTSGDLDTRGSASKPLIGYSDFDPLKVAGTYTTAASTNINADPQFNYPSFSLLASSPAVNHGAPEFIVPGGYGSQDIDGGTRVVGGVIDLGAYESLVNGQIAQIVTSVLDDGSAGTLRAAIVASNSNPNATPITFNIADANSCPQLITLSAPLPDITTDITIDGYSEPGARANTLYGDYDGQICVIVRAASNSVTHGLRVGAGGRLTVKGIEFEGFTTAAVRLAAGNGSIVVGNGFAATYGAAANDVGVLVEGSATGSLIGSTSVGDRNVFDQGTAAVDFENNGTAGGHIVEGNYMGLNFDGTSWTGTRSSYGVYVQDSGGNTIRSNFIGRALNEGVHLVGVNTIANTLVTNFIGEAPGGSAVGNGSAGILITSGAHDNVVGTASFQTQSGGGNYILNNFGPGVWLDSTAGSRNRIDGNNSIHDNSGFLPIDLGAASDVAGLGPTPNDSNDTDSGPNGLVNFPTLTQATRVEANEIALDGYLLPEYIGSTQSYRLDVFWTDTCVYPDATKPSDRPRGDMKRYVGYFFVTVDPNTSFKPFPSTTITAPKTIPGTGYLFATETDASGNTSEPGKCFTFTDDYIFSDGFGP